MFPDPVPLQPREDDCAPLAPGRRVLRPVRRGRHAQHGRGRASARAVRRASRSPHRPRRGDQATGARGRPGHARSGEPARSHVHHAARSRGHPPARVQHHQARLMVHAAWFVLAIVLVAVAFDFINGFHDAANSIATVVSTRVLTPSAAVVWAAAFNFIAVFLFGTAVAKTMGKGLVDLAVVDANVILAGLVGAIVWDVITWWLALPTSSSHAIIGGYGGAAVAKAGFTALLFPGKWISTLEFIVIAPVMGLTIALVLTVALSWMLRRSLPRRVDRVFRVLQLGSAAAYSLGHGSNDAQKTMVIIVGLLVAEQQ